MRVGRSMALVLAYVRDHPGTSKAAAAAHLANHREPGYEVRTAYASVDRCITTGLIHAQPIPGSRTRYALALTDLGSAVLTRRKGGNHRTNDTTPA